MSAGGKNLMVIVNGVRYRLEDAKRRGLIDVETKTPATAQVAAEIVDAQANAEQPSPADVVDEPTEKEASDADEPDASEPAGSSDPAGPASKRPASRSGAAKGK